MHQSQPIQIIKFESHCHWIGSRLNGKSIQETKVFTIEMEKCGGFRSFRSKISQKLIQSHWHCGASVQMVQEGTPIEEAMEEVIGCGTTCMSSSVNILSEAGHGDGPKLYM